MPDSEPDATDRPSHPGKAETGDKPCGTRQPTLRRALEYSAASTRVLSAKYNPILRKAFSGFAQGQQPGCGRQCKFSPQKKSYTRPAINHSPKARKNTPPGREKHGSGNIRKAFQRAADDTHKSSKRKSRHPRRCHKEMRKLLQKPIFLCVTKS